MNKKESHIGKRKADSSARKRLRKLHTSENENSCFTKIKKIVLYFKEGTIESEKLQSTVPSLTSRELTVQAAPSKKNLKKGKKKKRECEREGKEEGKGEERRERERREEKRGKKWRERY